MERFVGGNVHHRISPCIPQPQFFQFFFLTKEDRERCEMISGEELSPDETSKTNSSLKFSIPEIVPLISPLICRCCKKDKRDMFTSQIIVAWTYSTNFLRLVQVEIECRSTVSVLFDLSFQENSSNVSGRVEMS